MNQKERDRLKREKAKPAYDALMKFYPLTVEDLPDEIWRPVPNYEQFYHVSNYGRVKSFCNGKIKILKPSLNRGYLYVALFKDSKRKDFRVNRLVALTFIPNPLNKPEVNHKFGCKLNNYVGDLEWATAKENTQHAHNTGLAKNAQGEEHADAKFTNEQVIYIRENPDGLTINQLAEKFGVHFATISDIQLGRRYKNTGGKIRKPKKPGESQRLPEELRKQIRAEYKAGVVGCGSHALAKKYGVNKTTILNIVHEI